MVLELLATSSHDIKTRLQIIEANYGRDFGWYVERDGKRLGVLTEPEYAEMFWVAYRLEPISDAPEILAALFEDAYWCSPKYLFRSMKFPQYVVEAMGPVDEDHRYVSMRFLYIVPRFTQWEQIRYFWHLNRIYSRH